MNNKGTKIKKKTKWEQAIEREYKNMVILGEEIYKESLNASKIIIKLKGENFFRTGEYALNIYLGEKQEEEKIAKEKERKELEEFLTLPDDFDLLDLK